MTENLLRTALSNRRQSVFGTSVLLAGFSIVTLCFCPVFFYQALPESLFGDPQQENFFFSLFGFISACWLLCWVSTLNSWTASAKVGQWLGLLFLCLDQVILIGVWKSLAMTGSLLNGLFLSPGLVQVYLTGSFFGFFTLPGLTKDGNRTLTGLGTLALLLPWLVARDAIVAGTQYLLGSFHS